MLGNTAAPTGHTSRAETTAAVDNCSEETTAAVDNCSGKQLQWFPWLSGGRFVAAHCRAGRHNQQIQSAVTAELYWPPAAHTSSSNH